MVNSMTLLEPPNQDSFRPARLLDFASDPASLSPHEISHDLAEAFSLKHENLGNVR